MNLPFKVVNLNQPYQPEVSDCNNQWCLNYGSIPTSGNEPYVQGCGSLQHMEQQRIHNGGNPTGRGVTPCNFGYLQQIPKGSNGIALLFPYDGENFKRLSPSSILFDPDRPGYLPPQGNVRPLIRIGYEWRS